MATMNDPKTYRSALRSTSLSGSSSEGDADDEASPIFRPTATSTDFSSQASTIPLEPADTLEDIDHRRLSSLCLDIRDTCERRGTNLDIKRACKWLMNRDGVPQRLRGILWEHLLRSDMVEIESDDDVEGEQRENGELMGVWRRTSMDSALVQRLNEAVTESADEEESRGRTFVRDPMARLRPKSVSSPRVEEIWQQDSDGSLEAVQESQDESEVSEVLDVYPSAYGGTNAPLKEGNLEKLRAVTVGLPPTDTDAPEHVPEPSAEAREITPSDWEQSWKGKRDSVSWRENEQPSPLSPVRPMFL